LPAHVIPSDEMPHPGGAGGPIVVGGLGGSGTRAVAGALRACGIFMGSELNEAYDNLWFTLLIKRPHWLMTWLRDRRPSQSICDALAALEAMMTGAELGPAQVALLARAAGEMTAWGHDDRGSMRGPAAFRMVADYLESPPQPIRDRSWGWKEPNSHLVLPELIEVFPDLRYVHVVRHPLDMAWSANTTQARLWGSLCGLRPGERSVITPEGQVRWWLYSTTKAAEHGAALGDRFMLLRYETLCAQPEDVVAELAELAGVSVDPSRRRLAELEVMEQPSSGRWREHPLDVFGQELLDEIARWGYQVDADAE
jgi:hypothetical protein